MTLPLVPAGAGSRLARRLGGAALTLAVALAIGHPLPAKGEDADPYSATVPVDATADTASAARDKARIDGQRRALTALIERQAGGAPTKPLKLDDKAITNLVASFEVANERMSAVRYTADYTFHFRQGEVQRLIGSVALPPPAAGATAGGAAASGATAGAAGAVIPLDQPAKSMVLLPVYDSGGHARLWDDPNPWREAWEQGPTTGTLHPVIPLGDAGDIAAVDADKARAGDPAAIAAIARHNGGGDVMVAIAVPRGPPDHPTGLDVTLRRYRAGQPADARTLPIDANPGESSDDLMRRAVAAIAADSGSGWKKEPVPGYDQQGSLTAILSISGLDDWVRMRERLAGVPVVRKVTVVSLSRQEATIELGYVGSVDQLKAALAGINLDLVRGEPSWRLTRDGSARLQ